MDPETDTGNDFLDRRCVVNRCDSSRMGRSCERLPILKCWKAFPSTDAEVVTTGDRHQKQSNDYRNDKNNIFEENQIEITLVSGKSPNDPNEVSDVIRSNRRYYKLDVKRT